MLKPVLSVLVLALLSSCAISESNCRAGDWIGIGERDGKKGRGETHIQAYQKTCAKYDVVPVVEDWLAGREQGLKVYCTPENAYQLGRRGSSLNPVCEASLMPALNSANFKGQKYHDITSEINSLERERSSLRRELSELPEGASGAGIHSQISHINFRIQFLITQRLRYDSL